MKNAVIFLQILTFRHINTHENLIFIQVFTSFGLANCEKQKSLVFEATYLKNHVNTNEA